jgi:arylsulfatase A-like enzyme
MKSIRASKSPVSSVRNVILVMTDQQHFRTLQCTGAQEARTPHLDALASRGFLARNHLVTNPVCSPSRASIMTGRHVTEHGLWTNGCRLPHHVPTIPQVMGERGFQTAHFGKLHLEPIVTRVRRPHSYGFEICEVAEGDQQLLDDDYFRWLRTTEPDLFVRFVNEMYTMGHHRAYTSVMPEECHLSTWVTNRAVDWLENRRADDRPFFLSIGYFDPHHAFNPCEPYASMFRDVAVEAPVFKEGAIDLKPAHYIKKFAEDGKITRDEARITEIRRAYHAMMAHIDACVGRLLGTLDRLNLGKDTLILFTSDHGEHLGNHGLLWKGPYLLDDLLRVPLIISRGSGALAEGVTGASTEELSSAVDIFPTIEAMAGYEPRRGHPILGPDLTAFPRGSRDFVLAEWEQPRVSPISSLRCIRTRDAKLIYYGSDPSQGEYYDLANDPLEFENLSGRPHCTNTRRALFDRMAAHYLTRRPDDVPSEGGW